MSLLFGSSAFAQTNNLTLGEGACASLTTGDYNVCIGYNAGFSIRDGGNNTFGHGAGTSVTTATDNTFIEARRAFQQRMDSTIRL